MQNFHFRFSNFGGRILGLAGLYLLFSVVFRAVLWVFSFLVIIKQFSWLSIFFIFIIKAVPLAAALILLANHQWMGFTFIAIGLSLEYIMRFYIARIGNRETRRHDAHPDVIDV